MIDRILQLVSLGRVTLTEEDGPIARIQVDQGPIGAGTKRIIDKVKRFSQFGLASVPPLTSETIMVALGGLRSQVIAIATNHQPSRPRNMKPGDVRLYDVRGAMVDLTEDGLLIDAAGSQVLVRNASKVRVECDLLEVTGDVVSRADGEQVSLNDLRDAYAGHHHTLVKTGTDKSGLTDKTV